MITVPYLPHWVVPAENLWLECLVRGIPAGSIIPCDHPEAVTFQDLDYYALQLRMKK